MNSSIFEQFKQAGVGAVLPGDLPLRSIVTVGDALLASPVTAVEVHAGIHSQNIIQDLRQRARENMLVGVGGVAEIAEIDEAVEAGAQFVTSAQLRPSLITYCQQLNIPFIPGVISLFAVRTAVASGCSVVRLATGGSVGAQFVESILSVTPNCHIIVAGNIEPDEVAAYKEAGVLSLFASETLFQSVDQTMSDIISRARALQSEWGA